MLCPAFNRKLRTAASATRCLGLVIALAAAVHQCSAQETPLLSGGVGFFTSTNAGSTSYLPIIEPLLAAPLGQHILVESRAALVESFSPKGGGLNMFVPP